MYKAMKNLCVDADHQCQIGIATGDMLRCVAERLRAAEFFEADQVGELTMQIEKQIGFGFKTVVRTVVNHRWQTIGGFEDAGKVGSLSRRGSAAREHSRDHHQTFRSDFLGMRRVRGGDRRILCTGANDYRHACGRECAHAVTPLFIRQ